MCTVTVDLYDSNCSTLRRYIVVVWSTVHLEGAQVITREFEAYVVVWSGDDCINVYRQHGYEFLIPSFSVLCMFFLSVITSFPDCDCHLSQPDSDLPSPCLLQLHCGQLPSLQHHLAPQWG